MAAQAAGVRAEPSSIRAGSVGAKPEANRTRNNFPGADDPACHARDFCRFTADFHRLNRKLITFAAGDYNAVVEVFPVVVKCLCAIFQPLRDARQENIFARGSTIMTKADFIPATEGDFVAWHDQFTSIAKAKRAESRLPDEDVAQTESDNAEIHAKLAAKSLAAAAHKQATAEAKDTLYRAEANAPAPSPGASRPSRATSPR